MIKWEYEIETHRNDGLFRSKESDFLKARGEEGWELTAVIGTGTDFVKHYFKRQKVEVKEPRPAPLSGYGLTSVGTRG